MNNNTQWSFQVPQEPSNNGSSPKEGSQSNNKIINLFKQKPLRLFMYFVLASMIGWFLLNLFISPINRIFGLPKVDNLENYSPISSIEVYDKNDQFVAVLQGEEDRQVVLLSNVSTSLKQALFASEDRSFYEHGGINFRNIFRALIINTFSGKLKQGGSTLTQQLVKNIFFSPKEWATKERKIKELFLALEVEKKYTKDQILAIYLNQVYWGKGAYGVERASKRYFNKHASELNVAESAYLVALLSSPSTLHNTERVFKIQKQIIKDMVRYGYITAAQARDALIYPLKFESDAGNMSKFPYYMSVVLEELRSRFGEQELRHSGLKVYTALDQEAQAQAETILTEGIKKAPSGISQGALVTIDVQSNEVRVIVGGIGDFWKHQWNRATSIHTIGSAFKPFVYLTAFIKGLYSSNSIVMDTPFTYQNPDTGEVWSPKNFDKSFWGEITVSKALINSRNIPAIRIAQKTTMPSIIETAEKVGIKGVQPYLSSALGSSAISPLMAANAYAVLARGGIYLKPIIIKRIIDRSGKIVEQNNSIPEKVLPPNPIYELIDILVDVVDHGTGVQAKIPSMQIAGKTGTADEARDIWFIGFTPDTVTAVWGGNDTNKKASHYATGGGVMASIWRNFMIKYYAINPTSISYFPKPAQRLRLLIDPITGLRATDDTFQPEYRDFVPGTEPVKYAPRPTPEQIEKYLKEREEQRGVEEEDNGGEEIIEDPEEIEDQLIPTEEAAQNNTNNNTNESPQVPMPSVRPVLSPNQEIPAQQENNNIPPNNSQQNPSDNTIQQQDRPTNQPKKRFFQRFRDDEPQKPSRIKRLFSSPY